MKCLLVLALALLTGSVSAQEALWKDLLIKADALSKDRKFSEAAKVADESLRIAENTFGDNHPNTAKSLSALAINYVALGRMSESELHIKRSLAINERAYGPEHPDVATSLYGLAWLYTFYQEHRHEAEPLYRRSLAIREKAFGPENPAVAQTLNSLAALYAMQGKYSDAETLFRRALAIREKALGREHPAVAETLNGLAMVLSFTNRKDEAASMEERAKSITKPAGLPQAQQHEQPIIERVDLRGYRRIFEDMIRFFIKSKAGEPFSKTQLGLDIQALYNTGFFEDIQIQEMHGDTGTVVTFIIKERPIILSVKYVGNRSFSETDILDAYVKKKQELPIADSLYRPQMVNAAESVLKELMIQHGKPQGTVHTEIEIVPPTAVRIRFILNEDGDMDH